MKEDDCLEVARLHAQEFSDKDLLPSLGTAVLKVIYRGILKERKNVGYVAEEDGGIIGFITGSEDAVALFAGCVKKELISLSCHTIAALVRKPSLITKIPQALGYNNKTEADVPAELISIAVDSRYKGRGFGRNLADALISDLRRRGVNKMKVVVNKSNAEANIFYKKIGFIYKDTFKFCNKDMNLYVINL